MLETGIGQTVKELRKANNLTQAQLAKILEIKQPTIAYIEIGKKNPSIPLAKKMAAALGVSLDVLTKDV
jgi:transcriptional regulator with XRE-family HTH domain